jgi:glycosyltransferase involved in cell wall biosynthesis
MKLLVIAQKVDRNDAFLGFFHRWLEHFAMHFDEVTVITLYEGTHDLPANVRVFSLGKEKGASRGRYIVNFYRYIFRFRHDYDAVFVHQNQEYAILGGLFWKMMGKKVYMWRNHYAGSFITDAAAFFCDKIFCTSKYSYTAKFRNTHFMPVGIDTDDFRPAEGIPRMARSIMSLGRIAPSKNIHELIEALGILAKEKIDFTASLYGDALPQDAKYLASLKDRVRALNMNDHVRFYPSVIHEKLPEIYSRYQIFVNMSPSGMFDKTIFEAMACGSLVLSCNKNLLDKIDGGYIYRENNVEELAAKLGHLLRLSSDECKSRGLILRKYAEENHSLGKLVRELKEHIS